MRGSFAENTIFRVWVSTESIHAVSPEPFFKKEAGDGDLLS
jgi:hypothetical protein